MINEIVEFICKNSAEIDSLIDDTKILLTNGKANDKRSFILCSILSEITKENIFGENSIELYNLLKDKIKPESLNYLFSFLKDEKDNLLLYQKEVDQIRNENLPKLVDIDWKFIGLGSIDKIDVNDLEPKILLNLIFSNGSKKIIETDFATFKKFQEELDLSLSSFNSAYAKRINTFSK